MSIERFWKFASPSAAALLTVVLTPALSWSQVTPNVVIQWNNALLQGVRDSKIGPPMVARALAIGPHLHVRCVGRV